MRRRQIFEQQARERMEKEMVKVPNSNIISESAQSALKDKAAMFLPDEKDIVRPNGTPYRKGGSKPGSGAKNKTTGRSIYR